MGSHSRAHLMLREISLRDRNYFPLFAILTAFCTEPVSPAASATVSVTVTEKFPFELYVFETRDDEPLDDVPSP